MEDGIRLQIYQSHSKSNGIGVIINPCTLLSGKYQPVKLWKPTPEAVDKLLKDISDVLEVLGLDDISTKDLSLCQMDVTRNVWYNKGYDLTPNIRFFYKGIIPRHFEPVINHDKETNRHLYAIKTSGQKSTKRIAFKVYDKIYELKKNGRCPKSLATESVLRLEVSMKRESFLQKLGLNRAESLYEMLCTGYEKGESIIDDYTEKIFPFSGKVVSYSKAMALIEKKVTDDLLKEQMRYLVQKTSDSAGLSAAVRKLKDRYNHVDDRRIKKLFAMFDELNITPITKPKH